jgi:branched-chain amino acid transport system substrate-binding protein
LRVGVPFSQTGVTSAIERTQLNATLVAIDEINASGGVLGRAIEPLMYDPASDPKKFRAFAERLFQVDRIRLFFACYMSSSRKDKIARAGIGRKFQIPSVFRSS